MTNPERQPKFEQVITCASRSPRYWQDELRGIAYHFIGERAFLRLLDEGYFIAPKNYGENEDKPDWKGTPRKSILRVLEGRNAIWRIDMSAAVNVHKILEDELTAEQYEQIKDRVLVVLVGVESLFELEQRVKDRDRDGYEPSKFLDRMRADWKIWQENHFDHVVMNREGRIQESIDQVLEWVNEKQEASLVVMTGPTGTGKDTIMKGLLEIRE